MIPCISLELYASRRILTQVCGFIGSRSVVQNHFSERRETEMADFFKQRPYPKPVYEDRLTLEMLTRREKGVTQMSPEKKATRAEGENKSAQVGNATVTRAPIPSLLQ
jgi:hypothetical protein